MGKTPLRSTLSIPTIQQFPSPFFTNHIFDSAFHFLATFPRMGRKFHVYHENKSDLHRVYNARWARLSRQTTDGQIYSQSKSSICRPVRKCLCRSLINVFSFFSAQVTSSFPLFKSWAPEKTLKDIYNKISDDIKSNLDNQPYPVQKY